MLDYRIKTFLLLCQTMNYTKTAEELHMSQPAVSQHIRFLEQTYQVKLFEYVNRHLQLTEAGKRLNEKVLALEVQSNAIADALVDKQSGYQTIRFDCTFTFGEYLLPSLLCKLMKENSKTELCMRIRSTTECLNSLDHGEIDFVLIEGFFNKALYNYKIVKVTNMILVVPPQHPLCLLKQVDLSNIIDYPLIIRQKESRLRGILPIGLGEHNYSYESFPLVIQCGSMNVMKKMIQENVGIGFLHEDIVAKELEEGSLKEIEVEDFQLRRELTMVYLKDFSEQDRLETFYQKLIYQMKQEKRW